MKKAFGTYEIAKICQVTPPTIGRWIKSGKLPFFSTAGGHRKVWNKDLALFLKECNIPIPEELLHSLFKTVLIVDDEAQIRSLIRRILQKQDPDLKIHEAGDGFDAGAKVGALVPSLVVLDIHLPGVDGLKVCEKIRSEPGLKNIKILAISGRDPQETETRALQAGADAFLAKPLHTETFRQTAGKLLHSD